MTHSIRCLGQRSSALRASVISDAYLVALDHNPASVWTSTHAAWRPDEGRVHNPACYGRKSRISPCGYAVNNRDPPLPADRFW